MFLKSYESAEFSVFQSFFLVHISLQVYVFVMSGIGVSDLKSWDLQDHKNASLQNVMTRPFYWELLITIKESKVSESLVNWKKARKAKQRKNIALRKIYVFNLLLLYGNQSQGA